MQQKKLQWLGALLVAVMVLSSCARAISIHEAANTNKARCGKAYIGRK